MTSLFFINISYPQIHKIALFVTHFPKIFLGVAPHTPTIRGGYPLTALRAGHKLHSKEIQFM